MVLLLRDSDKIQKNAEQRNTVVVLLLPDSDKIQKTRSSETTKSVVLLLRKFAALLPYHYNLLSKSIKEVFHKFIHLSFTDNQNGRDSFCRFGALSI